MLVAKLQAFAAFGLKTQLSRKDGEWVGLCKLIESLMYLSGVLPNAGSQQFSLL